MLGISFFTNKYANPIYFSRKIERTINFIIY